MLWLQRNAWWLLLTMTVLVAVIGLQPRHPGSRRTRRPARDHQGCRPRSSKARARRATGSFRRWQFKAKTETAQMGRLHIAHQAQRWLLRNPKRSERGKVNERT